MRKFVLLLAILCLLSAHAWASDISTEVKGGLYFPTDNEIQSGEYLQAELQWKNVYIFGQYITGLERRISGQRAGMLDIWGVGIGAKFPINQYIKVYGQIGYYTPTSEMAGGSTASDWSSGDYFREAQWLYWRQWGQKLGYDCDHYRVYEYRIHSAAGAAVGLDAEYPLSKHLSVGMNFGYTYLRFQEQFYARNPDSYIPSKQGWIETRQEKDFGGFNLGINLTYRF